MRKSSDLFFVSSNSHKYKEVKAILDSFGVNVGFLRSELQEIQSDALGDIALAKAQDAFSKFKKPVIVEDAGLFVHSLGGFPGPYSSYVFRELEMMGF